MGIWGGVRRPSLIDPSGKSVYGNSSDRAPSIDNCIAFEPPRCAATRVKKKNDSLEVIRPREPRQHFLPLTFLNITTVCI